VSRHDVPGVQVITSLDRADLYEAEGVGFEPTVAFTTSVFKTDPIGLSGIPPARILLVRAAARVAALAA
jgi:hypothetical protein